MYKVVGCRGIFPERKVINEMPLKNAIFYGILTWKDWKRNFKWRSIQRSVPLKTLIWSKILKISSFFWLYKYIFLWVSSLLLINMKSPSHYLADAEKWKGTKTLKPNSYLSRQSFQGYRCKSDITIFSWMITWNYAYSPFNKVSLV